MIDGNKPKLNLSGNGLQPFHPSPFRDDTSLYDYDRSVYEVSPQYHDFQATIKDKPVRIESFNQRTNSANVRYPNGERATVTLPDNFFYKYDPASREQARRQEIQSKQGLSGADPVGQFVVETAALGPLFKLAGKAIGGVAKKAGEDFVTSYVGRLAMLNLPKGVKNRILINLASKTINNANPYMTAGGDNFLYHLLKPVEPVDNLLSNEVPVERATIDINGNVVDDVSYNTFGKATLNDFPSARSYFYTGHKFFPKTTSREELTNEWQNKFGKYFIATPEDPNSIGYFEPHSFIANNAEQMKKRALNTLDLPEEKFNELFKTIDAAAGKRIYVTPNTDDEFLGWYHKGISHLNANALPYNENSLKNTWIHELLSHGTDANMRNLPVKHEISKAFGLAPKPDGTHYTVAELYHNLAKYNVTIPKYNMNENNSWKWYELRATLEEARRNQAGRTIMGASYGNPNEHTIRTLLTHPFIGASNKKILSSKTNGYAYDYINLYKRLSPEMRRWYNKKLRILMSLPSITGGGYLFTQPYLNNNNNEK